MKRWEPAVELTKKEQFIIKRLKRTRKLFAFLRLHRQELFDDSFQRELEGMYRDTGAGDEAVPPAQLCMALVLQGYHRISDAEAVELTMMDLRNLSTIMRHRLPAFTDLQPSDPLLIRRSRPACHRRAGSKKSPLRG